MNMQALIDGMSGQWQRERAETQMTLGSMTTTTQPAPMRAFVVTVRGLQYVAMARSACMAVLDAHALHGVVAVAVKPLRTGKGAA